MPDFKTIQILDAIRRAGNDGLTKEKAFKAAREAVVPAVKEADSQIKVWKKELARVKESGKSTLVEMAKRLQTLQNVDYIPEPYTLPELKAGLEMLSHQSAYIREQNRAYSAAFADGGFRGDWKKTISDSFPQLEASDVATVVSGPMQIRAKIIADQRRLVAERARIDEYVKRGAGLVKQGIMARKKGQRNAEEILSDVEEALSTVDQRLEAIEQFAAKVDKKIELITKLTKPATIKKKDWTMVLGLQAEAEENRKKLKGAYKTLLKSLDVLDSASDGLSEFNGSESALSRAADGLERRAKVAKKQVAVLAKPVQQRDKVVSGLSKILKAVERKVQ